MSRNTKGFTLIELLIGTAITGILALSVGKMVYDAVSYRAKQYGVDESAETMRSIFSAMSIPVQTASGFTFYGTSQLVTTGFAADGVTPKCSSFKKNGTAIESVTSDTNCETKTHTPLTGDNIIISDFVIDQDTTNPGTVNVVVGGKYRDSLGEHEFTEHTALTSKAL